MSGQDTGDEYDLTEVTDGAGAIASLPNGGVLNAFCEAITTRDLDRLAKTRQQVIDEMDEAAMVDAAATIAAFNAYPRAADATGLPLEDKKAELTAPLRAELGLDTLAERAA